MTTVSYGVVDETLSMLGMGGSMVKPKKKDIKYGPAPKHLVAAIRKTLRQLVEEEDLDANLGMIHRFAMTADDMLMVIKTPEAVMRDEHAVTMPGVAAMPASAETYGASLIRQLVPALQQLQSGVKASPQALLEAIAMARLNGMTDVSAALEEKLVGKKLEGERPVRSLGVLPPLPPAEPTATKKRLKAKAQSTPLDVVQNGVSNSNGASS